ncbi:hypothetical protein [Ralstonia mojiangensis]|uniref:hypothetical protein n=1 Tax=Ralstonia mojiangensis TaxID=2953895 RepID=UPI0021B1C6B3|nr:hypothetical protein [Ralstonia mojiangensis]MCT7327323.1 hypothetical protein [Ralstonia mojiangensis]
MYKWIPITQPADFEGLVHIFDGQEEAASTSDSAQIAYDLAGVAKSLAQNIVPAVAGALVELSYVDKDYRSTYYHFYAKQGRRYRLDCVRVHLFGEGVSFNAESTELIGLEPERQPGAPHAPQTYFGFLTLRPTYLTTIGRSVLSHNACLHARGSSMVSTHKVHVLGYDLKVAGFPWMSQHTDISVCAHVACWAILRHYSERFRKYREYLTYDVTRLAHEFDRGGIVPSRGLEVSHAERVFAGAGTYPVVVAIDPAEQNADVRAHFFRQLLAYVESGFPLFVGIKREHAVAVVGVEWSAPALDEVGQVITAGRFAWDMVNSLVTVDDNHFPYIRIRHDREVNEAQRYTLDDIHVFIAPLADKIYYPAEAVDGLSRALPLQLEAFFEFPPAGDCLTRYFLTTVASLRRHMRENCNEFAPQVLEAMMKLPLTQFVWVVEYSSHEQWSRSEVAVRTIVDATANLHEAVPFWAIYDGRSAWVFDRTQGAPVSFPYEQRGPYSRMQANLSSPLAVA